MILNGNIICPRTVRERLNSTFPLTIAVKAGPATAGGQEANSKKAIFRLGSANEKK